MDKLSFRMSVRCADKHVASQIHRMKIKGVTVRKLPAMKETSNNPVEFIISFAMIRGMSLPVSLLVGKLDEIFKEKEIKLRINRRQVPLHNIRTIKQQIINALSDEIEIDERATLAGIARRDFREILEISAVHFDAMQSIGKAPEVATGEVDNVFLKLLIQDLRKERKRQVESLSVKQGKRKG